MNSKIIIALVTTILTTSAFSAERSFYLDTVNNHLVFTFETVPTDQEKNIQVYNAITEDNGYHARNSNLSPMIQNETFLAGSKVIYYDSQEQKNRLATVVGAFANSQIFITTKKYKDTVEQHYFVAYPEALQTVIPFSNQNSLKKNQVVCLKNVKYEKNQREARVENLFSGNIIEVTVGDLFGARLGGLFERSLLVNPDQLQNCP